MIEKSPYQMAQDTLDAFLNIMDRLKGSAALADLLKDIDPEDHDAVLDQLAYIIMQLDARWNLILRHDDRHQLSTGQRAELIIDHIQQAKLFALQCRWRACEMELEGVELTLHFLYWQLHILECPFIPPVSDEEVAMYVQYLHDGGYIHDPVEVPLGQDHTRYLAAYREHGIEGLPDWYKAYFTATDQLHLLDLPDIRGEREQRYIGIWRENNTGLQVVYDPWLPYCSFDQLPEDQIEMFIRVFGDRTDSPEQAKQWADVPPMKSYDKVPSEFASDDEKAAVPLHPGLSTYSDHMKWFSEKFGIDIPEHMKAPTIFDKLRDSDPEDRDEIIADALSGQDLETRELVALLVYQSSPLPVTANVSWFEAISECIDRSERQDVLNFLTMALDRYWTMQGTRVVTENRLAKELPFLLQYEQMSKMYIECLLKGRELSGEPRDFNF